MSLKTMPGFGKSGTSRIAALQPGDLCASRFIAVRSSADVEAADAARRDRLALDVRHLGERRALAQRRLEMASASSLPSATTSTEPSGRFRAKPATPSTSAWRRTK